MSGYQLQLTRIANYIHAEVCEAERGALSVSEKTVVFGRDGYGLATETEVANQRPVRKRSLESRYQVEFFRRLLAKRGVTELAFATSSDKEAFTWAMLLEGDHHYWANEAIWLCWDCASRAIREGGELVAPLVCRNERGELVAEMLERSDDTVSFGFDALPQVLVIDQLHDHRRRIASMLE